VNTLRHHLGFRLTDMPLQRMNLTVGIGNTHIVHVNQGNFTDAGARQRFGRPGTDAADADDAEMRVGKTLQCFLPVETRRAAKSLAPGVADNFHS
jgi:hypothetical protein